jgi:hypothetical protein
MLFSCYKFREIWYSENFVSLKKQTKIFKDFSKIVFTLDEILHKRDLENIVVQVSWNSLSGEPYFIKGVNKFVFVVSMLMVWYECSSLQRFCI